MVQGSYTHLDIGVADLAMGAVDDYPHQIDDARDTRKHHRHKDALKKKKGIENITVMKYPFFLCFGIFFVPCRWGGGFWALKPPPTPKKMGTYELTLALDMYTFYYILLRDDTLLREHILGLRAHALDSGWQRGGTRVLATTTLHARTHEGRILRVQTY